MKLLLALFLVSTAASATNYKYLDSPNRKITYGTTGVPVGAIHILTYDGKEPTNKDIYFPYQCFSQKGKGPAYWSDSRAGQNCNDVKKTTVFASSSFWYQPIPKDVVLHPNSAGFVKDFLRQYNQFYGNVTINTYSYSSPVYRVDANVTPVKVAFNNCQGKTWIDPTFLSMVSAVPIPPNALPAAGTDSEITIYQPSTNKLWELWVSSKDANGNWKSCWGGRIDDVSNSNGIFKQGYGTTATGLPFIGGQITAEELKAGKIEHVIGIALVEIEAAHIYSWPANRSDGYNSKGASNRIPEGLRFRLDPNIDVDKLNMTKSGKIIAKAAQTYGFVVWDKAGSISIRADNPRSYASDPYPSLYENKATYDVLKGFPWGSLQFLSMDYGKPK